MPPQTPWTSHQTLAQFRAIAWLRWRILLNGLRRKSNVGEMVGRAISYPALAVIALGPILGAGFAAWYFASRGHLAHTSWLLWAAFLLCQLLNINLGRSGTTFDPNELIRFPIHLRNFVAIRLFFGLLAPANILVSFMSLAIAVGVGIALPSLWIVALFALAVFAAANVLFTRMVFAWVDRWLSTRRARELFTALIFIVSIGFEWANVHFNPAYHHTSHTLSPQRIEATLRLYHRVHPLLAVLPPELTSSALVAAHTHHPLASLGGIFGTAVFAAAFLAVFALRMRSEFRGEVLSDIANAVSSARKPTKLNKPKPAAASASPASESLQPASNAFPAEAAAAPASLSHSSVGALFGKEVLYVRRNIGFLFGLIVPVAMIFIFAGQLSLRHGSAWVLPGAIAYTLLSVMPLSFNSFGLEAEGVQLYFLAPIRMRDLFLAKNLLMVLLSLIEMGVVIGVIFYVSGRQPIERIVLTLLWALATLLLGLTVGNLRSVSAPKRVEFSRAARRQASQLSALLSIGVLAFLALVGACLVVAAHFLRLNWLLLPVFAALLALAALVYFLSLDRLERYAFDNREELITTLCKKA